MIGLDLQSRFTAITSQMQSQGKVPRQSTRQRFAQSSHAISTVAKPGSQGWPASYFKLLIYPHTEIMPLKSPLTTMCCANVQAIMYRYLGENTVQTKRCSRSTKHATITVTT